MAICGQLQWLPRLTLRRLLSRVIIRTCQRSADVLRLFLCVNGKLIHADRSDRKMSMPPDLNTGVRGTKTEPVAAQLVILPHPYIWLNKQVWGAQWRPAAGFRGLNDKRHELSSLSFLELWRRMRSGQMMYVYRWISVEPFSSSGLTPWLWPQVMCGPIFSLVVRCAVFHVLVSFNACTINVQFDTLPPVLLFKEIMFIHQHAVCSVSMYLDHVLNPFRQCYILVHKTSITKLSRVFTTRNKRKRADNENEMVYSHEGKERSFVKQKGRTRKKTIYRKEQKKVLFTLKLVSW